VKIGPVDTEIALLIVKKKKLTQAKYNPSGKFFELCEWTGQIDRQIDILITILYTPPVGNN